MAAGLRKPVFICFTQGSVVHIAGSCGRVWEYCLQPDKGLVRLVSYFRDQGLSVRDVTNGAQLEEVTMALKGGTEVKSLIMYCPHAATRLQISDLRSPNVRFQLCLSCSPLLLYCSFFLSIPSILKIYHLPSRQVQPYLRHKPRIGA